MKVLSYLFLLILVVFTLIIVVMNLETTISFNIINSISAELLKTNPLSQDINLGLFVLYIYIAGIISAVLFFFPLLKCINDKTSAYQRQLEKTSVNNSENASRVDILENKIKVLEKALNDALNKNK